ncbi:uncharacterized protein BDR25DRAFT_280536 [Lindgomyces ingoldianus]|uniref:Uncharacterized protein n=1 Tax=Lindgomyces ingoldianus TaxID=673940 RepID=A0ACB6R743_9PLEO|nr:uncharacterized protein BDR25DRAFT_280536 [Lindgomyces ingoldianus]KAF2474902.1 hypothetical protein BDR25DRAFT_280536 [Lindgomyces ingoldianus]
MDSSQVPLPNRPASPKRGLSTIVLVAITLLLGMPFAIVTIVLQNPKMPNIVLGTKTIDAGPSGTKTVKIGLLTGPNDANLAGAYIAIGATAITTLALWRFRGSSRDLYLKIWGWSLLGTGLANLVGQFACLVYIFIVSSQYPQAKSTDEVPRLDNGQYDAQGKVYSKESWACMMNKLYPQYEGSWAGKACDDMTIARYMAIPLTIVSILLLCLALWQVQLKGGLSWLLGKKRVPAMTQSKDFIPM